MENASRALIIAAAVLIGIVIISLGVYLYALFSGQSRTYKSTFENIEVQKFNSKFIVYAGRDDLTAQDIITVWNKAKEYEGTDLEITIRVNNSPIIVNSSEEFLKNNVNSVFGCNASDIDYDSNGRIIKINFNY